MKLGQELRGRLHSGETVIGSWLALGSPNVAEILAAVGFDFLVVDLEHSPTSLETMAEMIRVIEASGTIPLVRVTSNDAHQIKRVLDAGAYGIVVPNIQDGDDAQNAVAATKYPPMGRRGVGIARAQGYGARVTEYRESASTGLCVVVQIESMKAVHHCREIASVDGVDALMIGPYDLSSDLGVPGDFTSRAFTEKVEEVRGSAESAGVALGMHVVEPNPDEIKRLSQQGFRFFAYGVDMRILDASARQGLKAARDLC